MSKNSGSCTHKIFCFTICTLYLNKNVKQESAKKIMHVKIRIVTSGGRKKKRLWDRKGAH